MAAGVKLDSYTLSKWIIVWTCARITFGKEISHKNNNNNNPNVKNMFSGCVGRRKQQMGMAVLQEINLVIKVATDIDGLLFLLPLPIKKITLQKKNNNSAPQI